MGDTISRQAAIGSAISGMTMTIGGEKWIRVSEVRENLYSLPSAESRWIPVTERLPEDGTEVWVTTEMLFEVTRACWHEDSNLWCHPYNSECLLVLRPIAWMEMSFPEPYKGGAEMKGEEDERIKNS